jgi:hypothetical protein
VENAVQGIEDAMRSTSNKNQNEDPALPEESILAKFLLIRWDQLQELASAIRKRQAGQTSIILSRKLFEDALSDVSDPSLRKCGPFRDYLRSREYEGHDFSKVIIWEVTGNIPIGCKAKFIESGGRCWFSSRGRFDDLSDFPCDYVVESPGILKCSRP